MVYFLGHSLICWVNLNLVGPLPLLVKDWSMQGVAKLSRDVFG